MNRKIISISHLILFLVSHSLSAQVYIDAEDASIRSSDSYITDNGRTLRWQHNQAALPWIESEIKRAGSNSVGMRLNGASGGGNQRTEYCLNSCWSTGEPTISDGETWYTGFSIQLDSYAWDEPTSWFVIQQTQQASESGQIGNYPFVALEIKKGNMLELTSRSGKNGNTQRNPSPAVLSRDIMSIQKGIWYDIVVGWKYSPDSTDGWIAVWIKTADQLQYEKYSIDNIRHGYYGAPQRIEQNKAGMYRGTVGGVNQMYFDEIRFSKTLRGAKIPRAGYCI